MATKAADSVNDGLGASLAIALYAAAQELVRHGVAPARSVVLASAGLIVGGLGRKALLDLGVSLRTVQEWHKEARDALADVDSEEPPIESINEVLEAIGVAYRVVRP